MLKIVPVLGSRSLWFMCFIHSTLYLLIPNLFLTPSLLVTISWFPVSVFCVCVFCKYAPLHHFVFVFLIYIFKGALMLFWLTLSSAFNMPANLENSAVATGLEKVSFHSNPKERQCQRMLKLRHNCTHLTR